MKYSKQLLAFSTLFAVGFSMPFGSRQDRAALIRGHKTHAPLITTSVNATSPLSTPPPVKNESYSKDNSLEIGLGVGGTIIFCLLFQTLRECFKESIRLDELNTHREQLRREREREEGIIQRAQEIAEAIAEARNQLRTEQNQLRTEQNQQRRDEQIAIIAQHPDGSYALMRLLPPQSSSPGVSRPRIEEDASLLSSVSAFFSSAVDFITSLARETPPQISTPTTNDPLVSSALNEEIPQTQTQPQTQHQLSSQRLANATASLVFAQQQQH